MQSKPWILPMARRIKHAGYLRWKQLRFKFADWQLLADDRRWALAERLKPFVYTAGYYSHTFLARTSADFVSSEEAPPILWLFWLGGVPNARRQASLDALTLQEGLEVRIIREPGHLLLDGKPFHSAFGLLHDVHKSDYLRAYAMHHYGGVYMDVKPMSHPLRPSLDRLNSTRAAWAVGYREITSQYVPDLAGNLGAHLKRHYRAVMGPSGFIFRPGSPFTTEWMRELHARLDYYSGALAEADAAGCNPYSAPANYPIRWSEILGDIIQPLSMKYHEHVVLTDDVRPALKHYR